MTMTTRDDDPYESLILDADIGAMDRLLQSMYGIRPVPGYREIANADGIHWYERIDDERTS